MWSILFHPSPEQQDFCSAELWERGTAGIVEEGEGWRVFFPDSIAVETILDVPGIGSAEARQEDASRVECERLDWDAIEVGERFYIAPPWSTAGTPAGRIRLKVDSPGAFGTGRHESTQLCLRALERFLAAGSTLLDVGCGSGILSKAAKLLGAGAIFSCDIDSAALATTRAHGQPTLFQGSADAVASASVDLTIANISAAVLDRLAADLQRVTKPEGRLIVSGFIAENRPRCFEPEEELREGDWLCWICRPEQVHVETTAGPEALVHAAEWWS